MRTILVVLSACLGGCSLTSYIAEQAWGQLRLLHRREPVARILRRPDLSTDWRSKLHLVLYARRYAFEQIGLKRTGAYSTFIDTHGEPIAHNLSASQKDALKPKIWRFPVVGSLPYIGFFQRHRALAMQQRLRRQDLDTYVRPVTAYSSLGWFNDPLYSSMLDDPPWRLVEVVIHETTHTTIFLAGQVGFNESLAVLVGQQGALNFLAQTFGPTAPTVQQAREAFARRRGFAGLVEQLYGRLKALYARPVSRAAKLRGRTRIFAWAKRRYVELFPGAQDSRFVRMPLNNAIVLSFGRYLQGLHFHRAVLRCVGRRLDRLVALYRGAQHFADPLAVVARRCGLQAQLPQTM